MDVSGLVLTTLSLSFHLSIELRNYGKNVKGARRDIQSLSNELFGLRGVLEHLKFQQEQKPIDKSEVLLPPRYSEVEPILETLDQDEATYEISVYKSRETDVASVLKQTLEFLKELNKALVVPEGRIKTTVHLLKWPLKQNEMEKHLKRLERVKTYFILSLVTDEIDQSRELAHEIIALRTLVAEVNHSRVTLQAHEKYNKIMEWLSPVDPHLFRQNNSQLRAPGTTRWFIEGKLFQHWSTSTAPVGPIFLTGITGAGKSTLMTAAIDQLKATQPEKSRVIYFYCSFSNEQSLHPQNVLGSLLAQTCEHTDSIYSELESLYAKASSRPATKPGQLNTKELVNLLIKQAEHQGNMYILVDGLNECANSIEILQGLKTMSESPCIRLLVSSINDKGIETFMREIPHLNVETLHPKDIGKDVALLVHSTLESHHKLKQLSLQIKSEIVKALTDGAQGMFRWVQCQLDHLSRLRTPGAIKKALTSLPATLDKSYQETLGRIDGEEDRQLTKLILQILTFTFRPLGLGEVCEMLQITPGIRGYDDSKRLAHPRDILEICGSLLKFDPALGIVTLAHHSVKTYLTSDLRGEAAYFRLDEEDGHRQMATYCLTYLSFDAFSIDSLDPSFKMPYAYPDEKFLNYAVKQWAVHTKKVKEFREPLWSILQSFLLSSNYGRQNFQTWIQFLVPRSQVVKGTTPLYYAASYGLIIVVQYLLDIRVDVEIRGGRSGATPINIASYRGHLDVVKLLLEAGADPCIRDRDGFSALQWATLLHHSQIVNYYREKGYKW